MSRPEPIRGGPRLTAAVLLLLSLTAPAVASDLVRVDLTRPGDFQLLLYGGFDILQVHASSPDLGELAPPAADLLAHRDDVDRLLALGLTPKLLQADYEGFLAARLRDDGPIPVVAGPPGFGQGAMGGYFTYAEMVSLLDHYRATYPNIVSQKVSIGTSLQGRAIWAIKVSDNPDQDENEPEVLFDSLQHAREPMSMHTGLWVLDHLVTLYGSDPRVTSLVDEREVWFVPCVNPDGYVYNQQTNPNGGGMWRKNRRDNPGSCDGVDLNRNWPTAWGFDNAGSSGDTCSETYRGTSAASEPEIAALDAFLAARDFRIGWSMHTFGEWMLEPYGYISGNPPGYPEYPEYSADMVAFNHYTSGPAFNLLYPANGSALDHYHVAHGMIAFSPEIGPAFWPPISQAVSIAAANVEPALLMIQYAGAWLVTQGSGVTETIGDGDGHAEPGETLDVDLTVRNKGQAPTGAVTLTLQSPSPDLTVVQGAAALPSIASLASATLPAGALQVRVAPQAAVGATVPLELTFSYGGLQHTEVVPIIIGQTRTLLRDDLEQDLGWIVGAPGDGASTGQWERGAPAQKTQNGQVIQPGNDATPAPGVACYVTDAGGGSSGTGDVDGGPTTLRTPVFDLSAAQSPVVRYARHYWCSTGDDDFVVDISNDGGQSWTNLETLTGSANEWTQVEVSVASVIPPTDEMQLRFRATDNPNNSVTEALVDDLEVLDFGVVPHLGVMGTPAPGATVELQAAGDPGSTWLLFLALGTGANPVPGVVGTLGLDPGTLTSLFTSAIAPDGLSRIPVPIPNNPALSGFTAYFQSIVVVPPPTFSNVATLRIQ